VIAIRCGRGEPLFRRVTLISNPKSLPRSSSNTLLRKDGQILDSSSRGCRDRGSGCGGWTRTSNHRINNPALYQLSYTTARRGRFLTEPAPPDEHSHAAGWSTRRNHFMIRRSLRRLSFAHGTDQPR
jgi:hypothetical protein